MSELDELSTELHGLVHWSGTVEEYAERLLAAGWRKVPVGSGPMIELVARALYNARWMPEDWPFESASKDERAQYYTNARAALAAMRIPTLAMGRAAYAFADGSRSLQEGIMGPREAIGLWQAMIDCALAEGENAGSPQDTAAER